MRVCYRANVSGIVQGVYFRVSAQQMAIDLGLSGHAKNLEDGSLEILICGDQANVESMLNWMDTGPEGAEVESVESEQVQWQDINHFSIS